MSVRPVSSAYCHAESYHQAIMLVNDMEHENMVITVALVAVELRHKAPCLDFIPKVCAGKVHLQTSSPPDKGQAQQ